MEATSLETRQVFFSDPRIEMSHGAGGKASRRLIEGLIVPMLDNPALSRLEDAAILDLKGVRVAVTTDSFVVRPLRFPGGSIGKLAVNGTVNDLSVSGARPVALVSTLILEAGIPADVVRDELAAMAEAAAEANVAVVGGDTKVVEHGMADGVYVTTAGIGLVDDRANLGAARVRQGDRVLVSGPIGDHGITILLARGDLALDADLSSDTRSVWPLVDAVLESGGSSVRWMRDPTRGGVASALNELARATGLCVRLEEDAVPVRPEVRGACEILGLDPLHIANEGQFLVVVSREDSEAVLEAMASLSGGEKAALIGEIQESPPSRVVCATAYGGTRIVDMLVGDPLPRIC